MLRRRKILPDIPFQASFVRALQSQHLNANPGIDTQNDSSVSRAVKRKLFVVNFFLQREFMRNNMKPPCQFLDRGVPL